VATIRSSSPRRSQTCGWLTSGCDYQVAERPIKFSIEDYAIVFSLKGPEPAPLYTRIIKVDPNTFVQGLRVSWLSVRFERPEQRRGGGRGAATAARGGMGGGMGGGMAAAWRHVHGSRVSVRVVVSAAAAAALAVVAAALRRRGGGGGGGGVRMVTSTNDMGTVQAIAGSSF